MKFFYNLDVLNRLCVRHVSIEKQKYLSVMRRQGYVCFAEVIIEFFFVQEVRL